MGFIWDSYRIPIGCLYGIPIGFVSDSYWIPFASPLAQPFGGRAATPRARTCAHVDNHAVFQRFFENLSKSTIIFQRFNILNHMVSILTISNIFKDYFNDFKYFPTLFQSFSTIFKDFQRFSNIFKYNSKIFRHYFKDFKDFQRFLRFDYFTHSSASVLYF